MEYKENKYVIMVYIEAKFCLESQRREILRRIKSGAVYDYDNIKIGGQVSL